MCMFKEEILQRQYKAKQLKAGTGKNFSSPPLFLCLIVDQNKRKMFNLANFFENNMTIYGVRYDTPYRLLLPNSQQQRSDIYQYTIRLILKNHMILFPPIFIIKKLDR